ncbi:MAG TPA: class I SAM-dependent methyltransferase [Candidatus Limiplasma sp.]|nr:class I SAM-dependent methyltransferase [Candidatus Limiplasma sp.]HRX08582.1 class I SAM-dependent methyltransferase [Candidatus Limiplasma sp.]
MSEDRFQGNTARMLKMDKRLRAAADWVEPCDIIADIGCDHGRLGAMLLLENRARHLIASDISEKSLQKAQHCLQRHGLTGRAELHVADGLEAITQKVDTICILGMGGETLSGILLRGQSKLHGATLVLGAHTNLYVVRKTLQAIGYRITGEQVIRSEGRMYMLLRAAQGNGYEEPYTRRELMLGPMFLKERPESWRPWLERRRHYLHKTVSSLKAAGTDPQEKRFHKAQEELSYTLDVLQNL